LAYVLLDSVDYRDDFPKYSVVQQDPCQSKGKEGRKVSKSIALDFHQ
jgi:hypothetical protein